MILSDETAKTVTAFHEAAHAVVAWRLRLCVVSAEIINCRSGVVRVEDSWEDPDFAFNSSVISLAGAFAETQYLKTIFDRGNYDVAGYVDAGAVFDYAAAKKLEERYSLDPSQVKYVSRTLVRDNWSGIKYVARKLCRHGSLQGSDTKG